MGGVRHALKLIGRPWVCCGLFTCAAGVWVKDARAQACHADVRALQPKAEQGLSAGFSQASAHFDTARYAGFYQMLALDAQWSSAKLSVGGAWAGYRITKNGASAFGLGDPSLNARLLLLEPLLLDPLLLDPLRSSKLGVGLATSLPFGERGQELGMGHLMLAPELWGDVSWDWARLWSALGYSRALAIKGEHDHGGPLVAPMTPSEVTLELRAGLRPSEPVWLQARSLVQVPTGLQSARAFAALGVAVPFPSGMGAVELAVPWLGSAFDWRVGSSVSFRL